MGVKAGPKAAKPGEYDTSHLVGLSGGARAVAFADHLANVTLKPWQRETLFDIFENRSRQTLLQCARQRGKSYLMAVCALYSLVGDDLATNPVVGLLANSEAQAKEVMVKVQQIVADDPDLDAVLNCYHNKVSYDFGHCRIQVFAASAAGAKGGGGRQIRGVSARLFLVDELAFNPDPDTFYSVILPSVMADPHAMVFAATTPGYDFEGPAYTMYQRWQAGDSEDFYAKVYEASGQNPDDEDLWLEANPDADEAFLRGLRIQRKTLPESSFKREHMGLWTSGESAWFEHGVFEERKAEPAPEIGPKTKIYLAFDGSYSQDSSALVATTEDLYVFVVGVWERPPGQESWRVPRHEVMQAVDDAFARYNVISFSVDKPYWAAELALWEANYGAKRVIDWPTQSRVQMAAAVTTFYTGVMEKTLTHDGNKDLIRHVNNCVTKPSTHGDYITKDTQWSRKKIDLAVAAVVSFSEAARAKRRKKKDIFQG